MLTQRGEISPLLQHIRDATFPPSALAETRWLRCVALVVAKLVVGAGAIPKQVYNVVECLVLNNGYVAGSLHGDPRTGTQAGDTVVVDLISVDQSPGVETIANAVTAVVMRIVF